MKKINALYGALIGDAVGVPYEFKRPFKLPLRKDIDMTPPTMVNGEKFERTYGLPDGTWSDDGALLLCLLESLLEGGDWMRGFAGRAVNWRRHGYFAIDGRVFDIGNQTAVALSEIEEGVDPSARVDEDWASGNGALMRGLAPALVAKNEEEAISMGGLHSVATHATADSIGACKVYSLLAYKLLNGGEFEESLTKSLAHGTPALVEYDSRHPAGRGWVIDSFWSAIWAIRQGNDFKSTIQFAISLGDDTDTTACIAGGLAAIMYPIPEDWFAKLRGKELLTGIIDRLTLE